MTAKKISVNFLFTSAGRRVELLRLFQQARDRLKLDGKTVVTDIDPLAPAIQVADGAVALIDGQRARLEEQTIGRKVTALRDDLVVRVRDNGRGFDPEEVREGEGLRQLKKAFDNRRVRTSISSQPGSGTEVTIRVSL